jgi:nucleotidyltransferase/DNA polymerase involved in DNA repair
MTATVPIDTRRLRELRGIGKAMLKDFEELDIRSVSQLARANPDKLYNRLNEIRGQRMDACVLDTFRCAVAQARNPLLPREQRDWWHWSRLRLSGELTRSK